VLAPRQQRENAGRPLARLLQRDGGVAAQHHEGGGAIARAAPSDDKGPDTMVGNANGKTGLLCISK
jgi:hypothetical protein